LGNGKETSIIDLANTINQITGSSAGVEFFERRNWDHVTKRLSNIDKARAILNYSPKVSFENGLANTYEWLKVEVG